MKVLGIIPARLESTRFPAKVLFPIHGKAMLHWVYERALASNLLSECFVATDNSEINDYCEKHNIPVIMTSGDYRSGTERCIAAAKGKDFEVLINFQADEPLLHKDHILKLTSCFDDSDCQIATLGIEQDSPSKKCDPNTVKLVQDNKGNALYFSREAIPNSTSTSSFIQHIGMYAFRKEILPDLEILETSKLETVERLEQLRWLANGFKIQVALTNRKAHGIDTPHDLQELLKMWDSEI